MSTGKLQLALTSLNASLNKTKGGTRQRHMSLLTRYDRKDLAPADHIAVAAALTTIHLEGMEEPPLNPKWDDSRRNEYSIRFIAQTPSFIIINALEGMRDGRDCINIFSLNTYRQAVVWEAGPQASKVTPVPQHLQPFFRQLTDTVHDIVAKRAEALQLESGEEDEKKVAEEKRKRKLLRRKDELDQERNKRKMGKEKKREREKSATGGKLKREILSRKNELRDRELKRRKLERRKMKEETKRKEKVTEQELKLQISRSKDELDHAFLVMNRKAFAAELASTPGAQLRSSAAAYLRPSINKMLEMATRGPEHDLCEGCGAMLRFCAHEECTIIGCVECFPEPLTVCAFCNDFACREHGKNCSICATLACELCKIRQACLFCGAFACKDCIELGVGLDEADEAECGLCKFPLPVRWTFQMAVLAEEIMKSL